MRDNKCTLTLSKNCRVVCTHRNLSMKLAAIARDSMHDHLIRTGWTLTRDGGNVTLPIDEETVTERTYKRGDDVKAIRLAVKG